jgi:hypothetical protein
MATDKGCTSSILDLGSSCEVSGQIHTFTISVPTNQVGAWVERIQKAESLVQCIPLAGSPGKCWFTKRTKVQYICMSYL